MGFLQILITQTQTGEKPQEMIHFSWQHRDILNITYEIITATYNVMWHSP